MSLTVRGYELDSYGHVNNTVYLNYMEQARWEFFNSLGLMEPMHRENLLMVVVEVSVRYQREARLFDELEVITNCVKEPPYIIFEHRISRKSDNLTLTRGKVRTVVMDSSRIVRDIPSLFDSVFTA